MKRAEISKANSITFGAETVGVGDTTVVGKLVQVRGMAGGRTLATHALLEGRAFGYG